MSVRIEMVRENGWSYFYVPSLGTTHFFSGKLDETGVKGLCRQIYGSDTVNTPRQVHKADILVVKNYGEVINGEDYDAVATNLKGYPVGIQTADCLPILMHDPVNNAVCAVHAGWRGSVLDIAGRAVKIMELEFSSRASDIKAVLGPSIQSCCFEVRDDVVNEVISRYPDYTQVFESINGSIVMDLKKFNILRLKENGVSEIFDIDLCTMCNSGLFYSYRRNKPEKKRMLSSIMLD